MSFHLQVAKLSQEVTTEPRSQLNRLTVLPRLMEAAVLAACLRLRAHSRTEHGHEEFNLTVKTAGNITDTFSFVLCYLIKRQEDGTSKHLHKRKSADVKSERKLRAEQKQRDQNSTVQTLLHHFYAQSCLQ